MIERLKSAFNGRPAAVIAIPQNCWAIDEESISDLIQWAVNEIEVKGVLLVGHSQGGTPADNVQLCAEVENTTTGQESSNRLAAIMECIERTRNCVEQNEGHFVGELNSLRQLPVVQEKIVRNSNFVQGLFFRAESGVFCAYDISDQRFRALIQQG